MQPLTDDPPAAGVAAPARLAAGSAPGAPPPPAPRPRRRLGVQIGAVLALLVLLDLLVRLGLTPLIAADKHQRVSTAWRVALYQQAPAVDVLLLGSSRVQEGLSPALIMDRARASLQAPVRILNLGLGKGTPQVNYWLLKNVIRPDKQPRLIIYGAAEYEFNAHLPLAADPYAEELATLADYPQAFPDPTQHFDAQLGFLLGRPWYLFRYRNTIHDLVDDLNAPATGWPQGSVQDAFGFVPSTRVMNDGTIALMQDIYTGTPGNPGWLQDYTVGAPATTRFEQFLQLAQARGIRVIVVNMPVTTVHETFLSPAAYAAYRAYLRATAARYGAGFADYDDHTLWREPADFADTNHLNVGGAKKLSNRVAADLLIPALRDLGWR